jgi:hypothetical protein
MNEVITAYLEVLSLHSTGETSKGYKVTTAGNPVKI